MNPRPTHAPAAPAGTSAEAFRQAFQHSPAMQSLVRARDGLLVEVNETFLRKLGFAREEVIGRSARDLDFWVEPEQLTAYRSELEAQGLVSGMEVRLRTRAGAILTVLLSSHPVEIEGERHFLSAGVDLTPRKEAEARLRESEQRLRESEALLGTAFAATPVMTTIARLADGKYVEVNEAFRKWLGREREAILGRAWSDFNLWDDPVDGERFFAELLRLRSVRDVECPLRRFDGVRCTLLVSADIIEIGGEPHIVGFALDITERKRAEAEQLRTLQRERELSQLKTDFVALVSHEFRTPLEIIMSSVDNLDRYHDRLPAEKREQLLRTINKSVRRMAGMMEEVLLLGRLDGGGTELRPAPLDLASLCQRVGDEMESATSRRCPIARRVDPAAAAATGDEGVLRHILTNLLSNAVKYSTPGAPVELAVRREGAAAVFRIADRGCGIPAADQARLFQAFHRGSNVRQVPGTGLGLLIVRRCVDLHGGTITCESAEGRGTAFTVRLPLFAEEP